MKRCPEDFKPSERTYSNLRKHGAIPEFVDYELDNFLTFFLDPDLPESKAKKSSWQMTCQVWMKRAWNGKAGREWEYHTRHHRSDKGGQQKDFFGSAIKVAAQPKPEPNYRFIEHEAPTETMSTAEGLQALKQLTR